MTPMVLRKGKIQKAMPNDRTAVVLARSRLSCLDNWVLLPNLPESLLIRLLSA